MKILIHIPQLIYGGAEKVLVDFSNYLVQKGHEVEILETYEKGFLVKEFNSNINFNSICSEEYTKRYYVSLKDIKDEKNIIFKLGKCVKKCFIHSVGYEKFATKLVSKKYKSKNYDVAINYLETQSPKFILENIKSKIYLQWIHIDVSKVKNIEIDKYKKYYDKLDKIVCVSNVAKNSFNKRYYNLKDKTEMIYNFYNADKIITQSNEYIYMDNIHFNIISVGRLVEQKGYERAIDVLYKLKTEGYKFRWYIIGDGILRDKLRKKINDLDLEEEIKLLGIKENPYPYIKQSDLFLLPSLYEGFPTVTIEAEILGKFIVATDVCGIREQINSDDIGLIVENTFDGLYNGLKKVLDNKQYYKSIKYNIKNSRILNNDFKYEKFLKILRKG